MVRTAAVVLFMLAFSVAIAQENVVKAMRVLYFEEWVGKCGAEALVQYTENIDAEKDPLYMAYKGAAVATTANCTSWPLKKLSRFRDGKNYIETAVERAPEDLEIRFLRYTIQQNIPDFLGYDNKDDDRKFILKRLNLQLKANQTDDLSEIILDFFSDTENLSRETILTGD